MPYRLSLVVQQVRADGDEDLHAAWTLIADLDGEEIAVVSASGITRAVTRKLWEKQLNGVREHGYVMQAGDGRLDALKEAQDEALDLAQYLEMAKAEVCCHDQDGCQDRVKHDARE